MHIRNIIAIPLLVAACSQDPEPSPYGDDGCGADDYECMLRMEALACESESELLAEGACHWESEPEASPLVCDDPDRLIAGAECFRSVDRCKLWLDHVSEDPTCKVALSDDENVALWRDECGWIGDAVLDDMGC